MNNRHGNEKIDTRIIEQKENISNSQYDVAIIGAGVVGAMIARELSKYRLRVVLLEKESDAAAETSSANSGIVHAGYDAEKGSLKAKLNRLGVAKMQQVVEELDVPYTNTGSLVLAFDKNDMIKIQTLYEQGLENGVEGMSILSPQEVMSMEPAISQAIVGALHASTAGIVCPYQLTIGAVENAVDNGVVFLTDWQVRRIKRLQKQSMTEQYVPGFLLMSDSETLSAHYVINAAGLYTDDIASMVGDTYFSIHPRKGEYLLLDKQLGKTVNHVVFQTPSSLGKGILVTPTADGNLLLGPNALNVPDKTDTETSFDGLKNVVEGARRSVPLVDTRAVIRSFAGLRAAADKGDFIIEESKNVRGFIHVAGIESPGLSSAPAFGEIVVQILKKSGLILEKKSDWNPIRRKRHHFAGMTDKERSDAVQDNPLFGNLVCRCESVTEAEIIDSIQRPAGARTLDAVKRRTRAGMGRCQGGFCTPRVVDILARELGISPDAVTKSGKNSFILSGPSKPEICPIHQVSETEHLVGPVSNLKVDLFNHSEGVLPAIEQLHVPQTASIVIIGGGPAGLAAAIEAKKQGVSDVIILEREKDLGGILGQCIHPGFGVHLFGEELTGPEYAGRFLEEARKLNITMLTETAVLQVSGNRTITAVSPIYGHFTIQAKAIIMAMGCRERAAGALSIPGGRPAGIMTAGSAQRFINMEGYLPGKKIVILGSGDIGLIMARRLTLEGTEVKMVCEVLPYAGGLTRNIVQCLKDFDIPLKLCHTVTALHGTERLQGVTIAQVDNQRKPIPGTEFHVACDTLLLSVGLIPENELSREAGIQLDQLTGGPSVTMDMQTSAPGIFACGNVVHVHDLVDHVSEEGRLAGRNAAFWISGGAILQKADDADHGDIDHQISGSQADEPVPVMAGKSVRYILPKAIQMSGIQPESRLLFRVSEPARNVVLELRAGELVLKKIYKTRVAPGEMESIQIESAWLKKVPPATAVSVHVVPDERNKKANNTKEQGQLVQLELNKGTSDWDTAQPEVEKMEPVTSRSDSPGVLDEKDLNRSKKSQMEKGSILNDLQLFVLDMDGTFYLGDRLLQTSEGFLERLKNKSKQFLFFTNNSSKSSTDYLKKLQKLGVYIDPGQMMTSGDVAISFLLRERIRKTVFLLGTESLRDQFRNAGILLLESQEGWQPVIDEPIADIVMVSFDTSLQYDKLSQACWHIREGAEFLATHVDWNCPVEGGFIPDCGAICSLIEASTGKKPRFLGKPCKETMDAVLERTGVAAVNIAFVGDRLYTDVATGVNNGASGILVLTGEAKKEDLLNSEVKPTWVFPSLRELGDAL